MFPAGPGLLLSQFSTYGVETPPPLPLPPDTPRVRGGGPSDWRAGLEIYGETELVLEVVWAGVGLTPVVIWKYSQSWPEQ